jgi:hypothetical protein
LTGPVDSWFEHLKNGTLSTVNVYWYDPELIMHTLMHFHATNRDTQEFIWNFIDELIRTYSQEMPSLQKQLRANILFSKFMETINGTSEYKALRLLLNVYGEKHDYQSDFMLNCSYYIGNKLRQIDFKKDALFFSSPDTMKKLKAKISALKINSVSDLIRTYKEEISRDDEIKKDPPRCRRLIKSLLDLGKPILSCEEELEAEHYAPARDPLGAPT